MQETAPSHQHRAPLDMDTAPVGNLDQDKYCISLRNERPTREEYSTYQHTVQAITLWGTTCEENVVAT